LIVSKTQYYFIVTVILIVIVIVIVIDLDLDRWRRKSSRIIAFLAILYVEQSQVPQDESGRAAE
jgi:hypothetical protein